MSSRTSSAAMGARGASASGGTSIATRSPSAARAEVRRTVAPLMVTQPPAIHACTRVRVAVCRSARWRRTTRSSRLPASPRSAVRRRGGTLHRRAGGPGVADRPADGVADRPADGVADRLGDGVADGLRDGVGDGLRDGVGDGLRDGVGDGLRVGVADGLRDRLRHRRRRHKMKSVGARGARKSASDTVEVAMVATFTLAAAVIAKIAVAAAIPSTPAAQAPGSEQPVVPATVALVETWPDGRINYELTSPRRASMWTPRFPRVDGYVLPEGAQPVFAVQFARVLVGRDIRVEVSVLLGSATPPGVPVATVLVSPGSRVVVEELTKFGVQPVTLSMVNVAP